MHDKKHHDILRIAHLAALQLTPEESARYQSVFEKTLAHFAQLSEVPVEGVEPLLNPLEESGDWRSDQMIEPTSTEELLRAAPDVQDQQFKVPPVVG